MGQFALGQSVPRTEDPRLLTGRGRYTDDFVLPRLAHGYVLRSPHAHARIRSIDVRAAQQMPGVLGGADRRRLGGGEIRLDPAGRCRASAATARRCIVPHAARRWRKDRAMLVGDPVAFVVAETRRSRQGRGRAHRGRLRAAAGASPRPIRRARRARRSSGTIAPDNECFFYTLGDKARGRCGLRRARITSRG